MKLMTIVLTVGAVDQFFLLTTESIRNFSTTLIFGTISTIIIRIFQSLTLPFTKRYRSSIFSIIGSGPGALSGYIRSDYDRLVQWLFAEVQVQPWPGVLTALPLPNVVRPSKNKKELLSLIEESNGLVQGQLFGDCKCT